MQVPRFPSAAPEVILISNTVYFWQYHHGNYSCNLHFCGMTARVFDLILETVLCSSLTKEMVLCIDFDCCVASFTPFTLQDARRWEQVLSRSEFGTTCVFWFSCCQSYSNNCTLMMLPWSYFHGQLENQLRIYLFSVEPEM